MVSFPSYSLQQWKTYIDLDINIVLLAVAELGQKFRWGIIFYVILRPPRMNVKYGLLIQQIPTKQE